MLKRWKIKGSNPQLQVQLSNALDIPPIVSQLLINRGITTSQEAQSFLKADISALDDPLLLKDMDLAIKRIKQAKESKEFVLIYGDYDVDGITSSVLLKDILTSLGVKAINYIPHRMSEGYGLNLGIIEYAKQKGVRLLISVDCGINAFHQVEALNQNNIDVIIIDHHQPSDGPLPKAVAVIDPKRQDCLYPFKDFASVGLVAKLSQGLLGEILEDHWPLIAVGTIADVVSLRGENRIFVKEGLPRLNGTKNKGLLALLDVAKIKGKKFNPYHVGFILGPRINATGRMGSAQEALDLLLSQDEAEAYTLAHSLEEQNARRQKIQNDMVQEAMSIVEQEVNFKDHHVIVIQKEGWHKGVLGIVASRIMEKYYRPTIVISTEEGIGTASARSIAGFHIFEALSHCANHLENFGGHKSAAGLTVKEENISRFRQVINAFAREVISLEDLIPSLDIDCEIPLAGLNLDLTYLIESLEPYGEGNRVPLFCSRKLAVKSQPVVLGKDTIKFWVTDGRTTISAVGFGMGQLRDMISSAANVDLAYSLDIDDWNKAPAVCLKLKDIKVSETA